jgi:DNA-binding MarR family transcriptional regulator
MQLDHRPQEDKVARVVDGMVAYGRLVQQLRFSPVTNRAFFADLPLTLPQYKALGIIASAGAPGRSGRELASLLGVGPSAVTPLVDRLVEHNFVTRQEDPVDRRILRLRVTHEGTGVLERMANLHHEMLAAIVQRIDPRDLPVVERALAILTDAVTQLITEQPAHV